MNETAYPAMTCEELAEILARYGDTPVTVLTDPRELVEDSGLMPDRAEVRRIVTVSGSPSYVRIDGWHAEMTGKIMAAEKSER